MYIFSILTRCFIPHYPHVKSPTNVRPLSSPLKISSLDMIMRESVAHRPSVLAADHETIRYTIPHFRVESFMRFRDGMHPPLQRLYEDDDGNPEIKRCKLMPYYV
jgi:hypothetical protein